MAQDFGDDMGDFIFQAIRRWISNRIRDAYNDHRYEQRMEQRLAEERKGKSLDDGQSVQPNATQAPEQTQPEEVCVPFGNAQDAAYFTKICRENGIQMDALADRDGNGFVRFDPADTDRLAGCCREFSELVGRLKEQEIADRLDQSQALDARQVERLREIKDLPNLPQRGDNVRTEPTRQPQAVDKNLTQDIADRVREAREQCRTFDDFKERLAERGIGITTTKDGENMFYQARHGEDGKLLPFGRDDAGNRDWAVGAKTLKERYDIDATHDWFERNTPQTSDGSLDADGRTPDINQGIESHDGMDTDTRTLKLEREQNGTDVVPSKVREEQAQARGDDRSLSAVSEQCRAASKQLETESGVIDRDIDISDKLSPVR